MPQADQTRRKRTESTPAVALSTAYAAMPVVVPNECDLGIVQLRMTAIAGGATAVQWYVSDDAAGDYPITPEWTDLIVDLGSGSAIGAVARDFNATPWNAASNNAGLYVWAKLNVGTASGISVIHARHKG